MRWLHNGGGIPVTSVSRMAPASHSSFIASYLFRIGGGIYGQLATLGAHIVQVDLKTRRYTPVLFNCDEIMT